MHGSSGRDVLLVERFDRRQAPDGERRRAIVSALTMLELGEMEARYASCADLAQIARERFVDAKATLRELFARITFNVLVGNTDDHARNHAAFWDGEALALTPAYGICPQPRSGGEASQAMAISDGGLRMSQLHWAEACDAAHLGDAERTYFWGRQLLNPYALQGYN